MSVELFEAKSFFKPNKKILFCRSIIIGNVTSLCGHETLM